MGGCGVSVVEWGARHDLDRGVWEGGEKGGGGCCHNHVSRTNFNKIHASRTFLTKFHESRNST